MRILPDVTFFFQLNPFQLSEQKMKKIALIFLLLKLASSDCSNPNEDEDYLICQVRKKASFDSKVLSQDKLVGSN